MKVSTVATWAGPFTVVVDGDGAVLAAGWTADHDLLVPLIHPSLRDGEPLPRKDLGDATRAVRAYHDGDLHAPDAIPVRQHSHGEFLSAAWRVLRGVGPGAPLTYGHLGELASRARDSGSTARGTNGDEPVGRTGRTTASRAAAQACARNAAALFVPCHRIVRADGSVGGFRWGPPTKQKLLAHETR